MRGIAALAALLLASCAGSSVCAGQEQGTLVFSFVAACAGGAPCTSATDPTPAGTCSFFDDMVKAGKGMPSARFTAIVSWRDQPTPDTAALCVQAPLAQDKLGTYAPAGPDAWTLDIPAPATPLTAPGTAVGNCPCAVDLQESLAGTLTRDSEEALHFAGTLTTVLSRNTAGTSPKCYTDNAGLAEMGDCPPAGAPCTVTYVSP